MKFDTRLEPNPSRRIRIPHQVPNLKSLVCTPCCEVKGVNSIQARDFRIEFTIFLQDFTFFIEPPPSPRQNRISQISLISHLLLYTSQR